MDVILHVLHFPNQTNLTLSHTLHLQAKLAELRDFVEANLTEAAHHQKHAYDQHTSVRSFCPGDPVWLSVPTAGKLEPRWEGDWIIKSVKGPTSMEITKGKNTKVVHTNRLQHRNVPSPSDRIDPSTVVTHQQWNPPTVDHVYVLPPSQLCPDIIHCDSNEHQIDGDSEARG